VPYQFKDEPYSSHRTILDLAGEGRGRRLLDVGASDGFLAERLTRQGWRVTALERDAGLAAVARRRCEEVVVADLHEGVPPLSGPFDVIVCGDVLEHLAEPERALEGLARHLAADGAVIVSVPNVAHLWVRLMLLLGRFDYADRGILDRTHLRFFTLKTFRACLARCGIRVERLIPVPAPLSPFMAGRAPGGWLQAVQAIHARGARGWPGGLAFQFVVEGRRLAPAGARA